MEQGTQNPNGPYPPPGMYYYPPRKPVLPNSIPTLVFGIISLATMALFGWIMGIVALNLGNKALEEAEANPGKYNTASLGMARAGKTMGLIGLILGLVGILVWVLYFVFIFWLVSQAEHSAYDYQYNPY